MLSRCPSGGGRCRDRDAHVGAVRHDVSGCRDPGGGVQKPADEVIGYSVEDDPFVVAEPVVPELGTDVVGLDRIALRAHPGDRDASRRLKSTLEKFDWLPTVLAGLSKVPPPTVLPEAPWSMTTPIRLSITIFGLVGSTPMKLPSSWFPLPIVPAVTETPAESL